MATDSDQPTPHGASWSQWLHRHFLWLLLGCYALAAAWPAGGLRIRHWTIANASGREVHAPLLLLALLLFCAAVAIRWSEVRELLERPTVLIACLLTAWVGSALVVVLVGPAVLGSSDLLGIGELAVGTQVIVGMALIAAMPVANSSAAWSQNAGGNVALSLGLVIVSVLLSPLATPRLLQLMGLVLSDEATSNIEEVVQRFSGTEFIIWVILPSLAGAATAWLAGPERVARARSAIRFITLIDLLLLNYANAALAMPKIVANESLATIAAPAVLALAIIASGLLLAYLLAGAAQLSRSSRIALLFGFSMKHTGLALVLAGEVLAESPYVILTILLATVLQHIVAAAVDWRLQKTEPAQ